MRIELRLSLNALTSLLIVNVVVFILAFLIQSTSRSEAQAFFILGGLDSIEVLRGSFWLTITSAFLHLDPIHFVINIYSLYRIGSIVYTYFNGKVLFLTYIIGGLGGSLLTVLATLLLGSAPFSLGASGAIFALIGLLLVSTLKKQRYGADLPYRASDILPIILVSLWIGLLPGSKINNWAHIGGLLTGVITGFFITHSLNNFKTKVETLVEKILYYISLVISIGSYIAFLINIVYLIFFI